jgi:hypothetical protein
MAAWVRVMPNLSLGAYEIVRTNLVVAEPQWPNLPFSEILKLAFRGFLIDSLEHPVVRRLRGLE